MWTTAKIRRHILNIPAGSLFATKELLQYGTRAAVDQSLCRLVKGERLIRIARGLFMKPGARDKIPTPSPFQIAQHKANAFGKQIAVHALDTAQALGLVNQGNPEPTFANNGCNSSFRAGDTTIRLSATAPQKMRLDINIAELMVKAVWNLGKANCDNNILLATERWGRIEREELRQLIPTMPGWMKARLDNLGYIRH